MALLSAACTRAEPEPASAPPHAATLPQSHDARLELGPEEQARMGLVLARPASLLHAPELRVFGRVLDDPGAHTLLRAPLAGELRALDLAPTLGATLAPGTPVFQLVPRWSPQDLADLGARTAAARGELATLEAELPEWRAALERAATLHAQDRAVSDRELAEARTRLSSGEARTAAARELLRVLEDGRAQPLTLTLTGGGEVVALLARAGEAVEAGAALLDVVDFSAPLVALDLPPGVDPRVLGAARVERADGSGATFAAERVGLAPGAGQAGLAPALLVRVSAEPLEQGQDLLRPGLQVSAWLEQGQGARAGVLVPGSAVVRLAGLAFVYARAGARELERVPLPLTEAVAGGWFAGADWPAAELELVVQGAQNVLSFELLGRQGAEEED